MGSGMSTRIPGVGLAPARQAGRVNERERLAYFDLQFKPAAVEPVAGRSQVRDVSSTPVLGGGCIERLEPSMS